MSPEDQEDRAEALASWFELQKIHSGDALLIMVTLLGGIISASAPGNPKQQRKGALLVCEMIMEKFPEGKR
jgi:hypothetical protein